MRRLSLTVCLIALVIVAAGVQRLSYGYFRSEELSKAEGRLSVYQGTVGAELERFSHLTHVLAADPFVIVTTEGGDRVALSHRLKGFADHAGIDAIYLMDPTGLTVAASNAGAPNSFLGQDYSFRPYFQQALNGSQGRFYGIGATTGLPGYFIAGPVRDDRGDIRGVIAIKIDLTTLQQRWQGSGEQVLLTNKDGVVLLASDPSWLYQTLATLTAVQREDIAQSRQFPGQAMARLDWAPSQNRSARIDGEDRLYLTSLDLPHDWTLHYFASDERAVALSWAVTAALGVLAGFVLIVYQVQRARRMGEALRRSEREEWELRQANERLAIEIEERRTAERRLKRTQGELESASRLAALGQLAASVTHELGQPIAAMRNHLAAAEIGGNKGDLPNRIGALVERMEGITRQLKFFARREPDEFGDVDLGAAMRASVALIAPNTETHGIAVTLTEPDKPVSVRGNRLRLEQVMTNLLRNASDALDGADTRKILVTIDQTPASTWFEIRDSGHGLGASTLADLQEPFVTTRESGQGMGLGLAISAGIVKDHGAAMTARNGQNGGAVFRVDFPNEPHERDPT